MTATPSMQDERNRIEAENRVLREALERIRNAPSLPFSDAHVSWQQQVRELSRAFNEVRQIAKDAL